MKKFLSVLMIAVILLGVTGCGKEGKNFKKEYEGLNGNSDYRSVSIPKKNPIVYASANEIVEKLKNKETFYVYFGSVYCPWCRSVIEKALEVANNKNINKIYYVDIWDGEHNEILRDTFEVNEKGEAVATKIGTEDYYELLNRLNPVLDDYVLTNDKGEKLSCSEKRIFAPTFIYVENGEAIRKETGISDKQENAKDELTDEIKTDEENKFNEFFLE